MISIADIALSSFQAANSTVPIINVNGIAQCQYSLQSEWAETILQWYHVHMKMHNECFANNVRKAQMMSSYNVEKRTTRMLRYFRFESY